MRSLLASLVLLVASEALGQVKGQVAAFGNEEALLGYLAEVPGGVRRAEMVGPPSWAREKLDAAARARTSGGDLVATADEIIVGSRRFPLRPNGGPRRWLEGLIATEGAVVVLTGVMASMEVPDSERGTQFPTVPVLELTPIVLEPGGARIGEPSYLEYGPMDGAVAQGGRVQFAFTWELSRPLRYPSQLKRLEHVHVHKPNTVDATTGRVRLGRGATRPVTDAELFFQEEGPLLDPTRVYRGAGEDNELVVAVSCALGKTTSCKAVGVFASKAVTGRGGTEFRAGDAVVLRCDVPENRCTPR